MMIEADRSFYRQYIQSIQDNGSWIPTESREQVSEIVNIFQDYQNGVLGIISKNRQLTSETFAEINTEEWTGSIYGTLLGIFCVFSIMDAKRHHDLRKLEALI